MEGNNNKNKHWIATVTEWVNDDDDDDNDDDDDDDDSHPIVCGKFQWIQENGDSKEKEGNINDTTQVRS